MTGTHLPDSEVRQVNRLWQQSSVNLDKQAGWTSKVYKVLSIISKYGDCTSVLIIQGLLILKINKGYTDMKNN